MEIQALCYGLVAELLLLTVCFIVGFIATGLAGTEQTIGNILLVGLGVLTISGAVFLFTYVFGLAIKDAIS